MRKPCNQQFQYTWRLCFPKISEVKEKEDQKIDSVPFEIQDKGTQHD